MSLEDLALIESSKMRLVMDKGFYGKANVHERYYRDFFTIYEAAADSLKCSHGWQNISTVFSISSDNKAKPGNAANSDTIHRQGTPPCHVVMHRKEEGSL